MTARESNAIPRWIGAFAERVVAARGDRERVSAVLAESSLPMVLVDDDRRYIEVNEAAERALGPGLPGNRRVDDFTPPLFAEAMEANWTRMKETGVIASPYGADGGEPGYLGVTYYALADAVPGLHLVAFAPPGWADGPSRPEPPAGEGEERPALTPRELEVLGLAAAGHNGPVIARLLTVSPATVRTHFENIYEKLGVRDRAGAVAQALRRGLIS
jgi:DNA-binding CsgD family transcriptional regulator